jgi:hypothetical protein
MADATRKQKLQGRAAELRGTDYSHMAGEGFLSPPDATQLRVAIDKWVRPAVTALANSLELIADVDDISAFADERINATAAQVATTFEIAKRLRDQVSSLRPEQKEEKVREAATAFEAAGRSIFEYAQRTALEAIAQRRLNVSRQETELQDLLVKTREAEHQAVKLVKEGRDALDVAHQVATQVGLNAQASAFDAARKRHACDSAWWLVAGFASSGLLGRVCYLAVKSDPPGNSDASWTTVGGLSYLGARAFTLSVLSFLLVVCVRNYRAARHNEIVNGFRADAVATLEALRKSGDGKVETVLTALAGQAVFGPQNSGYGDSGPVVSNHLTELLAGAKSPKAGADEAD